MSSTNQFEELQKQLKEMFQFDHNDLNFGIYKIYNLKNKEVEKFINGDGENSLKTTIQNSLKGAYNQENDTQKTLLKNFLGKLDQSSLLDDLEGNKQKITGLIDVMGNGNSEKLKQALKILETDQNKPETPEDKVYNHILNFFSLYYENGDFGYNERSISPYQVDYPNSTAYNGQDTMLFWKHKGQYYIKSGSGFNSVKFDLKIGEISKKIEYKLETNEDSEEEQTARNNNKDDKSKHYKLNRIEEKNNVYQVIFNLAKTSTVKEEVYKAILKQVFNVEYDDKYWTKKDGKSIFNDLKDKNQEIQNGNIKGLSQIRITKEDLEKKINEGINKNDTIPQITQTDEIFTAFWSLDKSLNNFYIGNDSDFFIHQNLKEFLNKEQDKFIKNHILSDIYSLLEANSDNQSLLIAKAFKKATDKIIEFLATVEEFQEKLFEKPKNVVQVDYLITLDKIDPKHYSKILQNQKQIQNWIDLGMIKGDSPLEGWQSQTDGVFSIPDNLKTLPLDTAFFDEEFKNQVLNEIDNLDKQTNGLLIKSENWQALNLLKEKYRGKVKCIYIDPPYNTGSDGFLYKDSFKHSSWLSFMENRLRLAKEFLSDDGVIFVSIDDNEVVKLKELMDEVFGIENFIQIVEVKSNEGAANEFQNPFMPKNCEYGLFYAKNNNKREYKPLWVNRDWDKAYNKIVLNPSENDFKKWKIGSVNEEIKEKLGDNPTQKEINTFIISNRKNIFQAIAPKGAGAGLSKAMEESKVNIWGIYKRDGLEDIICYGGRMVRFVSKNILEVNGKLEIIRELGSLWTDIAWTGIAKEGLIKMKSGKKPEKLLKRVIDMTTEEGDLVMDFFVGSGTTGAVAHKMGRKYIGVEMGEYFDTKTFVRLQHVLNGEQTGISTIVSWKGGGITKYLTLEQYEDVLDNLERKTPRQPTVATPQEGNWELPDGLPFKYWYTPESLALDNNLDLKKPFDNKTKIGKDQIEMNVDLAETYNYLRGLEVKRVKVFEFEKTPRQPTVATPQEGNYWQYKAYQVARNGIFDTLIVWRNIDEKLASTVENNQDIENLKKVLAEFPEVDTLEVNFDVLNLVLDKENRLEVNSRKVEVRRIKRSNFEI